MKLAEEVGLAVHQRLRRGGFGYLKSKILNFCQMAEHVPLLMLTDLDRLPCAPNLISNWLGQRELPPGLLLRVAVREVESWLLADHAAMGGFLGLSVDVLPNDPDRLNDPKQSLLTLAQRARRSVRDDLVVKKGTVASQGLGYNARLCKLVRQDWSPNLAAARSPSLARARLRLREFAAK